MKRFLCLSLICSMLFSTNCFASEMQVQIGSEQIQEPKAEKFIIDTDFSSDVDDALAISTALWFDDVGLVDVEGISICCSSVRATYAMSALTYSHGYYDIPISLHVDSGLKIGSKYHLGMTNGRAYSENYVSDNVKMYRKILAESKDAVNIVSLGQFNQLYRLLNSQPDEYSSLTGAELVAQKVKCLYCIATKYTGKPENNMFYGGETNEPVADMASFVANNWGSKIVWIPAEVGGLFAVGQFFNDSDRACSDILTKALADFGRPDGHTAFDPMAVYVAMCDACGLSDSKSLTYEKGAMSIYSNGSSYFNTTNPYKEHYVVYKGQPDKYYQDEINQMLGYEFTKRTGKKVIW